MSSPLKFGDVLLPRAGVDLNKFACIACDQFTSDLGYWNALSEYVGNSPSALGLILPEIFLNDNADSRLKRITENMNEYVRGGVFEKRTYDAVLTERRTPFTPSRLGIVVGIDLDAYEPSGEALIRASEAVVASRIPARVEIRERCPLELPHVMLLADDEDGILVEAAHKKRGKKLYDFELNMGGGSIAGYEVEDTESIARAAEELTCRSEKKYGAPFLFAVGDGNHSLAAAKAVHEKHKDVKAASKALVEIVNVRSSGIAFHPIHRLVKVKNAEDFVRYMQDKTRGLSRPSALYTGGQVFPYSLPGDAVEGVELVQKLVDEYETESVDYVHGEEQLTRGDKGTVGVRLFAPEKSDFFDQVARRGKLPKKTFSIGEGVEKRYYLEARKIVDK